MTGTVYLVGAGPGDAGLLTIRAHRLIEIADVVIFDRLVGDDILALIPDGTAKIDVGKNAGSHPVPQDEIGRILLREAGRYKTVVRLKGGDPFVFGRGGEEAELLFEHGIPFEIVPGVTSAIAAPAYAGIPVTHRDCASSLHIITGHGKQDSDPDIAYESLARLGGTLVFMMSVSSAPSITAGLIGAGMSADMPAALIENGTTVHQRSFVCTLGTLTDTIERESIRSPAVIVVGEICRVSEKLAWATRRGLSGCRVLVTRPRSVAAMFGERLRELGADVTYYPCIETYPLVFDIGLISADWAIFTSAAGVDCFFSRLHETGRDARVLGGLRVAAVGAKTASALLRRGIRADFTPDIFDGVNLAHGLLEGNHICSGDRAILYRAREGGEDLTHILRNAGVEVRDVPVYETRATVGEAIDLHDFDYVTFTSASCVNGLAAKNADCSDVTALCIGEQTANAAKTAGMRVIVSDRADTDSMIEKLLDIYIGSTYGGRY